MNLYATIQDLSCSNDYIRWQHCRNDFSIRHYFSDHDWNNIIADIHSDEELQEACKQGYISVYKAYFAQKSTPIGFVLIMVDDPIKKYVSIHGGGWDKSASYFYICCYMAMIVQLLQTGVKVHTSCKLENKRAMHLNHSIGFVNYAKREGYSYKYINKLRLQRSLLYKRFMNMIQMKYPTNVG